MVCATSIHEYFAVPYPEGRGVVDQVCMDPHKLLTWVMQIVGAQNGEAELDSMALENMYHLNYFFEQ